MSTDPFENIETVDPSIDPEDESEVSLEKLGQIEPAVVPAPGAPKPEAG